MFWINYYRFRASLFLSPDFFNISFMCVHSVMYVEGREHLRQVGFSLSTLPVLAILTSAKLCTSLSTFCLFFPDRVSLCSPGTHCCRLHWPWTQISSCLPSAGTNFSAFLSLSYAIFYPNIELKILLNPGYLHTVKSLFTYCEEFTVFRNLWTVEKKF